MDFIPAGKFQNPATAFPCKFNETVNRVGGSSERIIRKYCPGGIPVEEILPVNQFLVILDVIGNLSGS